MDANKFYMSAYWGSVSRRKAGVGPHSALSKRKLIFVLNPFKMSPAVAMSLKADTNFWPINEDFFLPLVQKSPCVNS